MENVGIHNDIRKLMFHDDKNFSLTVKWGNHKEPNRISLYIEHIQAEFNRREINLHYW